MSASLRAHTHTMALDIKKKFDAVDSLMADLSQSQVVEEKLDHCPAAEVPSQKLG